VIAGRAKVTTRNFPASLAGLAANVLLLVLLVPSFGIAGAGIALCGAYVVMLTAMHVLTRRAFVVQFEWRRLLQLLFVLGGVAVGGDLLLPTKGLAGLLSRLAVFAGVAPLLYLTRFAHEQELGRLRLLVGQAREAWARGSA
jgi:O-antigen/teichoic acid export membrane protein